MQCILDRINNIEKTVIDLYKEKRRRKEAQKANRNETKSINSSASFNISSEGVLYDIWTHFIKFVYKIMTEKNLTLDEVYNKIVIKISDYGMEKICMQILKNFYHKNNFCSKTLDKISIWIRNNK